MNRVQPFRYKELLDDVLGNLKIHRDGYHGPVHWARVRYNGLLLAERTGADPVVIELFAFIHDSQRLDEADDLDHGPRAAAYAAKQHGKLFSANGRQLAQLIAACEGHTNTIRAPDLTVQCCWDADRLDIGRVGIRPDPAYLGTAAAKDAAVIEQAYRRSIQRAKPYQEQAHPWLNDDDENGLRLGMPS